MKVDINTKMITLIGTPLGQSFAARMQNAGYEAAGLNMLYFYTDGVSESENKAKELYSEERLLRDLEQLKGETPQAVVETVAARLRGHAAGAEQNDDITMLCIRYKR